MTQGMFNYKNYFWDKKTRFLYYFQFLRNTKEEVKSVVTYLKYNAPKEEAKYDIYPTKLFLETLLSPFSSLRL